MTTLRSDADVLVLGSTLGGLVAATYLARAGLRVILLEEQAHQKRPPLLREPFLLPGLEADGPTREVLRELSMPLLDQQEIHCKPTALQVVLPEARIEVQPDPDALARELAAYGLVDEAIASAWLWALQPRGESTRRALWEPPPAPARSGSAVLRQQLHQLWPPRAPAPVAVDAPLPSCPPGLRDFVDAILTAMAGFVPGVSPPAPAFLLDGAMRASWRMPHSGAPFLDLFRRRFLSLHGEIWPAEQFALISERGSLGVELPRTRCLARSLVLAVPRDPLRRFLAETDEVPRWLKPGLPVAPSPARLFRVERERLPVGLGDRTVVALPDGPSIHWLSLAADPQHAGTVWMVAAGPGAATLDPEAPLASLSPFAEAGTVHVDPGPEPRWDLDASELRFPSAEPRPPLRHRRPLATVGPELAPGLGPEGEILQARRAALRLAERLGS